MQDYFKSTPRVPTPTKEAKEPIPIKDVSFKLVADVTKYVSLVDLLDMDDMDLESIDTTIASVAVSALMKENPTQFSMAKCPRSPTSEPQPSQYQQQNQSWGQQPPGEGEASRSQSLQHNSYENLSKIKLKSRQ